MLRIVLLKAFVVKNAVVVSLMALEAVSCELLVKFADLVLLLSEHFL